MIPFEAAVLGGLLQRFAKGYHPLVGRPKSLLAHALARADFAAALIVVQQLRCCTWTPDAWEVEDHFIKATADDALDNCFFAALRVGRWSRCEALLRTIRKAVDGV